jgi:hypothetical protein
MRRIHGYDKSRGPGFDIYVSVHGYEDNGRAVITQVIRETEADRGFLNRPRVRFNWGYWDGAALTARGIERQDGISADNIIGSHFDPFYAHGFVAGCAVVKGQGMDGQSSVRAWTEFQAGLTDSNLLFQIEVNP